MLHDYSDMYEPISSIFVVKLPFKSEEFLVPFIIM